MSLQKLETHNYEVAIKTVNAMKVFKMPLECHVCWK